MDTIFIPVLLILHVVFIPIAADSVFSSDAIPDHSLIESGRTGCTVFSLSKGGQVFFCGNDDYVNPDSYYWVDPGNDMQYGVIWIGQPDNVQQGVNEHGLAYDANGLPRIDVNSHPERLPVSGSYTSYPMKIKLEY